ncbi:hypothetical protein ZWY2020_018293 [Hordeum vulgare]|nr:hypothetical protein ZWY2020_018293 [Hordeum vulgare]
MVLERAVPLNGVPLGHLMELDRARHARMGVVNVPVQGNSNPFADDGSDISWVACEGCGGCLTKIALKVVDDSHQPFWPHQAPHHQLEVPPSHESPPDSEEDAALDPSYEQAAGPASAVGADHGLPWLPQEEHREKADERSSPSSSKGTQASLWLEP